jgi:nucleotide-binding universal stress UspA family protein
MNNPYQNIALAVSFSPTSKKLLLEAKRLQTLFSAKLSIIHIGSDSKENKNKLYELITSTGLEINEVEIIWEKGEPTKAIMRKCKERKFDLLIAGALEAENALEYYTGSVARKLMRSVPCSVLFINTSGTFPKVFKKVCISVEFTHEGEQTLKKAFEWGSLENAKEITLLREFRVPGLSMLVNDNGSIQETEGLRNKWEKDELDKMDFFVRELNLPKLKFKKVFLYGKQGWESKNYTKENKTDLLIVPAPKKKLGLFDRIFPSGIEFLAKHLPCSLLIVKPE